MNNNSQIDLIITKADLDSNNYYIGKVDVSNFEAGLSIFCKLLLNCKFNIFAGIANYKKTTIEEQTITCGKLESGEIKFGTLIETGI